MRKLRLGFVMLFVLQLGVSAPKSKVDLKPSSSTSEGSGRKTSLSAVATPQALGDQIVKYFDRKTGKELMDEKTGSANAEKRTSSKTGSAGGKPLSGGVTQSQKNSPVMKPGYVPPPPAPRVSVPQIRLEIQKILDLNKQIRNVQSGSSIQLQRVQEQARIHQKILNELENSQKPAVGQKALVRNSLLAQEKIRIIHEETQRNTQMIEGLKAVPASSIPKVTPKATSKVSTSAS